MSHDDAEAAREAVRAVVRDALDRDADWAALAAAGLLALPVPEAYGGEGLGLAEVAELLRETGARGVDLPVWETLCCGVLTLVAAGSDEQRSRFLPGVARGEVLLSPAVREVATGIPERPATTITGGRVSGRKVGVTRAGSAAALLVPVVDGDEVVVVLVDPPGPGRDPAAVAHLDRRGRAHRGPRGGAGGPAAGTPTPPACCASSRSPACASRRPGSSAGPAT